MAVCLEANKCNNLKKYFGKKRRMPNRKGLQFTELILITKCCQENLDSLSHFCAKFILHRSLMSSCYFDQWYF